MILLLPCNAANEKPYWMMFSYFCVFRHKVYLYVSTDKQHILNIMIIEVMFVGYEPGSKGYQLF